jgi:CRISPR-associated protein Cas2
MNSQMSEVSMSKQFVLVVYDISNDRRRTKLHNVLLDYGTPVQYSVFECFLTAENVARMKAAVRKIIRPRRDNVRYYRLCAECMRNIEAPGGDETAEPALAIVV